KKAYQFRMKAILERTANLQIKQASATEVDVESGKVRGVTTDLGVRFRSPAVVVTAGTFLRALLHVGNLSRPGGRMADASSGLSESIRKLGFEVGRFKTGTPCRLNGRSIDFSRCERQDGDDPPPFFSFLPREALSDPSEVFT